MSKLKSVVVGLCVAASGACWKADRAVQAPRGEALTEKAKNVDEDSKEESIVVGESAQGAPGVASAPVPADEPAPPPAKPYGEAAKAGRRGYIEAAQSRQGVLAGVHAAAPAPADPTGSEEYAHHDVNKMTLTKDDHESTFAIDVDTASYTIARKKILAGETVPPDAVRVEEFVNYFRYSYEGPGDERPFAVHMEAAPSPYQNGRTFLRVGVQGKQVSKRQRKKAHLVFLVDVSGSMDQPDKLPLAQRALRILVDNLNENDTVAMVTYAGATRVVLNPTNASQRATIYAAIDELTAGGSTAMGSGIQLAYDLAAKQLTPDSETRVIVLSDGDANVGQTSHEEILKTIHGHVKEGVTLSTVGFGMGNYKDTMMEQLADHGNGANYYIDGLSEAKRVFQEKLAGTLEVIAQDVKIQVDFDPKAVVAYRLVGYENRDIADRDFRNDKVDAGEIGAGHSVTAVYEVELAPGVQANLATVRIRAKKPRGKEAAEYAYPFARELMRPTFDAASADFRFAAAVVGFAEILRHSPYADGWKLDKVMSIARAATPQGNAEREEFLTLVGKAKI